MTLSTLLQLADGTFPSGAFAHSSGLEAMSVLGGLHARRGDHEDHQDPLAAFLDTSLRHASRAILPFVLRANREPTAIGAIDHAFDATLPLLFVNEASRAQGRALASAIGRVWEKPCEAIATYARESKVHPAHHGPIFGAIFGTLGIAEEETAAAYLHGAARGILSSGVRLGLLGPLEAQRLIAERASVFFDSLIHEARHVEHLDDAAQAAPVLEIFAALHDRLDGRMFQS